MPGKPHQIQPGSCEGATAIKYINTTGQVLPCIDFKSKVHMERWCQDHNLPSAWRMGVSRNE